MAAGQVVGDVEEAAPAVVLGADQVRLLDQPDEAHVLVGDVGPVEGMELAVELDQQAERREVLDRVASCSK